MESKTIADQALEYEAPSMSVFPVARVITEQTNKHKIEMRLQKKKKGTMPTMKSNARKNQSYDHSRCRNQHDPPSPNRVNPFQRDQREQKVSSGDDESNSGRLIETDFGKQGSRVIHQGIETTELLKGLHATTDSQSTSVDGIQEHGLGTVVESGGLGYADRALDSCVENFNLEASRENGEIGDELDGCL